jgi:hypothetical protein
MVTFDKTMRHKDADGRLHVDRTVISIANVCPYLGKEIPDFQALGLDPQKTYQMYRDPRELAAAAPTFKNVPLLQNHVAVSAEAPKKDSIIGTVSDISFEDPYLYGSLAVWDAEAIRRIESGAQEQISAGYYFVPVMQPGTAPDGTRFDGRMTELVANHAACVAEGRVGPESTIADETPEEFKSMKSSIAARVAAIVAPHLKPDVDRRALALALDGATTNSLPEESEEQKAEDAACDNYGYEAMDWNTMSAEDKKAARDRWKKVKDKKARDTGDPDHRDDFKSGDSAEAVRAQMRAAFAAREAVKPIVGVVTMDSADEVYGFALKHLGVDVKDIHKSAWPALFRAHAQRRQSGETHRAMAYDSDHTVSSIWH